MRKIISFIFLDNAEKKQQQKGKSSLHQKILKMPFKSKKYINLEKIYTVNQGAFL